jgi:hypothetical protein
MELEHETKIQVIAALFYAILTFYLSFCKHMYLYADLTEVAQQAMSQATL